jgi:hypothetical protein
MLNLIQHIHGKEKAPGFMPAVETALTSGDAGEIITR